RGSRNDAPLRRARRAPVRRSGLDEIERRVFRLVAVYRYSIAERATRGRSPPNRLPPGDLVLPPALPPRRFRPSRGRQSPAKCGALQDIPLEGPPGFEPATNGL